MTLKGKLMSISVLFYILIQSQQKLEMIYNPVRNGSLLINIAILQVSDMGQFT